MTYDMAWNAVESRRKATPGEMGVAAREIQGRPCQDAIAFANFVIVPLRMMIGYVPVPFRIRTATLEAATSPVSVNPFKSTTTGPSIGPLMLIAPKLDPEV
jgi:hypothetical protein